MEIKRHNFIISVVLILVLMMVICMNLQNNHMLKAKSAPNVTNDEKVIYLTFDDGPSPITNNVLDILKKKDVKATFFLIGNQIKDNKSTVKRIYNEGHGIGLHTYTHENKKIYRNESDFIKEMNDTREEVNKTVKVKPNIIRFPEGSRKRLNTNMLKKLHGLNYRIYDWNIVTSDGIRPSTSPRKLFIQATGNKNKPKPIILLMHCSYVHKNTYKALPKIIDYYKQKGYKFKVITNNTPELYFPIWGNTSCPSS